MNTININQLDLIKIVADNTALFGDAFQGVYVDTDGDLSIRTQSDSGDTMPLLTFSGMGEFIDGDGRHPGEEYYDSLAVARYIAEDKECLKSSGTVLNEDRTETEYEFNIGFRFEITRVQLFDYAVQVQTSEEGDSEYQYSYSANLIINDSFLVQVSGNKEEAAFDGVPDSGACFWNDASYQDMAFEVIDDSDLKAELEANGFENNIGWLTDHADDIQNPENAQYREF